MSQVRHPITLNGQPQAITALTLEAALGELGFGGGKVATALNGEFVPAARRAEVRISAGDRLEVVSARMGG